MEPQPDDNIIELPLKAKRFIPPTIDDCMLQAEKIGLPHMEAEKFHAYYTSCGWSVGRKKMVCWKAAFSGWTMRWRERQQFAKQRIETPSINVQMIQWGKELETIQERMKNIKGSYSEHQSWDAKDKNMFDCLKKRKAVLLEKLGREF